MARRTPPLSPNLPMVDEQGKPTPFFMRWWQDQIDTNKEIVTLSTAAEVSAVVDLLGNTHGDILFRGVSQWGALAAGTAGQALLTQGGGANPQWGYQTFLSLSDVPASYAGQGGLSVVVKAGEDGLEFAAAAGGDTVYDTVASVQGVQGKSATTTSWNLTVNTDPSTNNDLWIITLIGQTDNPPTGMTFDGVAAVSTNIRALGTFDWVITAVFEGITGTGNKALALTGSLGSEYRSSLHAYQVSGADATTIQYDSNTDITLPGSLTLTATRPNAFAASTCSVSSASAIEVGGTMVTDGTVGLTEGVVETTFRSTGYRQDGLTEGETITFTFEETGTDDRTIGNVWMIEPKVIVGLNALTDVTTQGRADGDVLTYDAATGLWGPEAPAGGGSTFLALTDTPSAYTGFGSSISGDFGDYSLQVSADASQVAFTWGYKWGGYQVYPDAGSLALPFSTTYSASAFAAKGNIFTCVESVIVRGVTFNINDTNAYKLVVAELTDATTTATISRILFDGAARSAAGGGVDTTFTCDDNDQSAPLLEAGKTYVIACVRTDAGNTGANATEFPTGSYSFTGTELTALYAARWAEDDPVVGDTPYFGPVTSSAVRMNIDLMKGNAARTISDQADLEISDTQGSILYRDANRWVALPPGTADHVLKTKGGGANPVWEAESGGGGGAAADPSVLSDYAFIFDPTDRDSGELPIDESVSQRTVTNTGSVVVSANGDYDLSGSQHFQIDDTADMLLTDRDFVLTIEKLNLDSTSGFQGVVALYQSTGNQRSFLLRFSTTTLQLYTSSNGSTPVLQCSDTGYTIATDYKIVVRRVGATLTLEVDDVVVDTASIGASYTFFSPTDEPWEIGEYAGAGNQINGQIGKVTLEITGKNYAPVRVIDDLADVDTSTVAPSNGDVLTWDAAASQWEPAAASGGGGEPAEFRGFSVSVSGTQAISSATSTPLNFGTTNFDTESGWSTNTYTVPAALNGKKMLFTANIRFTTQETGVSLFIQKDTAGDGTFLNYGYDQHDTTQGCGASALLEVATGDVVRVLVFTGTAATIANDTRNNFQGSVIEGGGPGFEGFIARRTTAFNTTALARVAIVFDTEITDPDAAYDNTTGVCTVPAAWNGKIVQFVAGYRSTNTGQAFIHIEKSTDSGSTWLDLATASHDTQGNGCVATAVDQVATGDLYRVRVFTGTVEALEVGQLQNRFQAFVVGA